VFGLIQAAAPRLRGFGLDDDRYCHFGAER
jgi:hypothetical protein